MVDMPSTHCCKRLKFQSLSINYDFHFHLGNVINTPGIEDAPFFDVSTSTIYFSSNGHVGAGGFDIWMSKYDSASGWQKPINVGFPVNSTADDLYFNKDKERIYFTSDRGDGLGSSDIHIGKPLDIQVVSERQSIMITVRDDKDSTILIDVEISAIDSKTRKLLPVKPSGDDFFELELDVLPDDTVTFSLESDGYMYLISDRVINEELDELQFYMEKILPNETYVLGHIFFEFNSAELDPESFFEIDKLEYFLKKNPTLGIDIQGHTDEVGSDDYNLQLSRERAEAVGQALQRRGIDPYRVITNGFGETRPIDPSNSRLNRRVEFSLFTLEAFN